MTELPLRINTPAGPVELTLQAEEGAVHVSAVVPEAHRLADALTAASERFVQERGFPVSCRIRCSACCRHLVAVTPLEAFILVDAVASLPADAQQTVAEKAAAIRERLASTGLDARIAAGLVGEAGKQVVFEWHQQQLACPLLVDDACSIYESRPAGCRQLLVITDPVHCADPAGGEVRPTPVFVNVQKALVLLSQSLFPEHPSQIPLPHALEWVAAHPELKSTGARGVDLVRGLLQATR